jgi:hypothetical protein
VHRIPRHRAQNDGDVQRVGDHRQVAACDQPQRDFGRRGAGIQDDRLTILHEVGRKRPDPPLLFHVLLVMQRHAADLGGHRVQKGPAVFARDLAVLLQPLQILPDRRLADLEGNGQIAHPGRALFLDPVQNAASAGFGQKTGGRFGHSAPFIDDPQSSACDFL